MEFVQHGFPPSQFSPAFPLYLVLFLVGAPAVLPLGLWLSTAGLGLWAAWREPRVWAAIAVVAAVVAILWLVLAPACPYPACFNLLIHGAPSLLTAPATALRVQA